MAFRPLSTRQELRGFYLREKENVLEGVITKLVPKVDGPFFIVLLSAPCKVKDEDGTISTAEPGDYVGLSATATVKELEAFVDKGIKIRVRYTHSVPSKKYKGKSVPLYELAVDDGPETK